MSEFIKWTKLFTKSKFFSLKKDEELNSELLLIQSKLDLPEIITSYHPQRKKEFILGRICAAKAYQESEGKELYSLSFGEDRSPLWPSEVVGSITHDPHLVGAAIAKSSDLLGLGIDFEEIGRTSVRLASHIRSSKDLKTHSQLSERELLTIIFSCKESFYKALYPSVKKYFGFKDAAILSIDLDNGLFVIELLNELNFNFGPQSRHLFNGRFMINEKKCLTLLEIGPIDEK